MAHDVFISYSSKDKIAAEAVCAGLEAAGIRAWMAPRDIVPGMNWGGSIVKAIADCRAFVLIFSGHANGSTQVTREVERAVGKGKPVVLFRLEIVLPSADLEYFISAPHWHDATTPPLDGHVRSLGEQLRLLLAQSPATGGVAGTDGPDSGATLAPHKVGPSERDRALSDRLSGLAETALAEGDPGHAADHLRKALGLNPDNEDAHFLLATALLYDGQDVPAAVREYREVTRLNPHHFLAHLATALVLRELCDFPAAAASARAALSVDPASTEARALVAELRDLAGDPHTIPTDAPRGGVAPAVTAGDVRTIPIP